MHLRTWCQRIVHSIFLFLLKVTCVVDALGQMFDNSLQYSNQCISSAPESLGQSIRKGHGRKEGTKSRLWSFQTIVTFPTLKDSRSGRVVNQYHDVNPGLRLGHQNNQLSQYMKQLHKITAFIIFIFAQNNGIKQNKGYINAFSWLKCPFCIGTCKLTPNNSLHKLLYFWPLAVSLAIGITYKTVIYQSHRPHTTPSTWNSLQQCPWSPWLVDTGCIVY